MQDAAPWTKATKRRFQAAAVVTLMMVGCAYLLLWLAVSGVVAAWAAFSAEGVSVLVAYWSIMLAIRSRRRDVARHKKPANR
ncbi:MAG: hypothetical protein M0Z53_00515 [Thermaerobacter sp.]|nr:hypothetical protein [Thermaerobacter sp.]